MFGTCKLVCFFGYGHMDIWSKRQNVKRMDPQYLYYTNGYVHLSFWDDSPPVIHLLRMAWLDKSVGPAVGSFRQKPHQKIYDDKI